MAVLSIAKFGFFRLRVIRAALLGITLALAIQPVCADQTNLLNMSLEQLLQVSVTASTLRAESIKTVPSSATVFTREQLDTLGFDYLHELLNLVPGFQTHRAADSGINYTYSIRGRRQGGRAREILLLVDGRVFSDPRSGGADSALVLFPLANIERIELIRGPASAIYGSGAFTGVINIISRREQNRVSVGVGENQRGKLDINLSHSVGEWQSNLYAHLAGDKGQRYLIDAANTRDPRQEAVLDWNLKYRDTRFYAFVSDAHGDDFYTLEKIRNGFNHYRQKSQHFRLEQKLTFTEHWQANASINYQQAEQQLHAMLQPEGALAAISIPASSEPMLSKATLVSDSFRFNFANDLTLSERWSWQFGSDWLRERQTKAESRANYDLGQLARRDYPIRYYGNFDNATQVGLDTQRDTTGLYSQWLYDLTPATGLVGGVRYDYYSTIGGQASPRMGVVHQLNETHTLKLLYSEAFRAPGFGETHLINSAALVSNPDLDNETVKSWELIWLATWSHLTMGASFYQNEFENPISVGLMGNTRTYINGVDEKNMGVGIRLEWQLNPQWMLRGHYTSLMDLPDNAFREADELSSFGANYQRGKWNWNLSAVHLGERQYLLGSQRQTQDAYWYANSQLRYHFNHATSIALAVKNALDSHYATPPQGASIAGGVPNRGREASLTLEWML
jgi:outer membrane receptor protein involved in Fe transport